MSTSSIKNVLPSAIRTIRNKQPIIKKLNSTRSSFLHTRVPLPYALESGLSPFLSTKALKTVAKDWQEGVLDRLNVLVRGK